VSGQRASLSHAAVPKCPEGDHDVSEYAEPGVLPAVAYGPGGRGGDRDLVVARPGRAVSHRRGCGTARNTMLIMRAAVAGSVTGAIHSPHDQ
jgi:hypothetical protein